MRLALWTTLSSLSLLSSFSDTTVSSLESCCLGRLGVCRWFVRSPSLSDNGFGCVCTGVQSRIAPRVPCAVVTFLVLTSESEPVFDQKSRHLCVANDPASSLDQMQTGWRATVDRFATFWSVHKYLSLSARLMWSVRYVATRCKPRSSAKFRWAWRALL